MHCMGYFSKFPPPSFAGIYSCSMSMVDNKVGDGSHGIRFSQRLFDSD